MISPDAPSGDEFLPLSASTSLPFHAGEAENVDNVLAVNPAANKNENLADRCNNIEDGTGVSNDNDSISDKLIEETRSSLMKIEEKHHQTPKRQRRVGFHPLPQVDDGDHGDYPVVNRERLATIRRNRRLVNRANAANQRRRKVLLFVGVVYGIGLVILLALKSSQLARLQRYIEGPPQALSDVFYLLTEADSRTLLNHDNQASNSVLIHGKRKYVSNINVLKKYRQSTRPLQAIGLQNVDIEILSEALITHFDRLGTNQTGEYPFLLTLNLIGNKFNDAAITIYLHEAMVHRYCYISKLLLGRNQNLGDETANSISDVIDLSSDSVVSSSKSKAIDSSTWDGLKFISFGGTSVTSEGLTKMYQAIGQRKDQFDFLGLDYTDLLGNKGFFQRLENHSSVKKSLPFLYKIGGQLRSLSLTGNSMDDDDITMLVKQLLEDDGSTRIASIDVMNNNFGVRGLKSLFLLIQAHPPSHSPDTIESQEDCTNKFQNKKNTDCSDVSDDQHFETKKNATSKMLLELHLAMNEKIGDEGAIALANVLKDKNPPLETLTLFQCGITQKGADALLNIFPNNTHLKHLILQQPQSSSSATDNPRHNKENEISNETVVAIRKALRVNWER